MLSKSLEGTVVLHTQPESSYYWVDTPFDLAKELHLLANDIKDALQTSAIY